ncbi:MAG: hypothetical protein PHI35_05995 [Victivallaceae bacterium]|nr:hypothetical protein [Victivallaceae bacterium]
MLDFSGTTRSLWLQRNGMRTPFELPAEGVARFPGWTVEIDRSNTLRALFDPNGRFSFTLKEPLSGLVLALRNAGAAPEIRLDGKPISAGEPCSVLPQGFYEEYLQTKEFSLDAGLHELTLSAGGPADCPYLPLAFLCGSFAHSGNELAIYQKDGVGLSGYVGKIVQRAMVEIPCDALRLCVDSDGIGCSLKLDGHELGRRLGAPFSWNLPRELCGQTVEVELIRYLSCGAMFGPNPTSCYDSRWKMPDFEPDNRRPPKPFCDIIRH